MAKQVVYFNATKQIETITIHYNQKLDGAFVEDVAKSIKDISKKMSKIDLKNPKEFENIQVFIYPSKQLFYKIFGGEIEKRFYSRRRSLEDFYVVQDSEGNIHIVSPRGMAQEKRDELKKILVMKVLGEYMEEKEKQSALRLLKESMKPKVGEQDEIEDPEEIDEQEVDDEAQEIDDDDEMEPESEKEQLEDDEEPSIDEQEVDEEEVDEEELEEIIETELVIEQIDEEQNSGNEEPNSEQSEEVKQKFEDKKILKRSEAQDWLNIGWLAYINGKLKKEADIKRFAQNISVSGIKKLGQLSNTRLFESYNFSKEYACAWVEYIVNTYGMKKFTEHYENPKDIKGVFGVSKFVFESQLKAYIKEKYNGNEKMLNITEDIKLDEIIHEERVEKEESAPITELTILHFSETGGVDIIQAEPIERSPLSIE